MVVRLSPVRLNGKKVRGWREDWAEPFIPRLARAEAEGRIADPTLVNAMLRRGASRHVPRHQSLSEMDGDWN
ncbi:MAG: hypothetical protein AAB584_02515 [Patescibacteria group bacterium]